VDDWVFVDTCIWAAFFSKPGSDERAAVDDLIDNDRVALVGPVVAEVLLGFRRRHQADWVASRMRRAHWTELDWDDWRAVASLGRRLASLGYKLPLTDLTVAVVAQRLDACVYTTDPHFDAIEGLRRYWPETK
jgi:predicted nucleic acid-binding protein